ncbi:hypothetical protein KI387_021651, partial [Taxus chinensis]
QSIRQYSRPSNIETSGNSLHYLLEQTAMAAMAKAFSAEMAVCGTRLGSATSHIMGPHAVSQRCQAAFKCPSRTLKTMRHSIQD